MKTNENVSAMAELALSPYYGGVNRHPASMQSDGDAAHGKTVVVESIETRNRRGPVCPAMLHVRLSDSGLQTARPAPKAESLTCCLPTEISTVSVLMCTEALGAPGGPWRSWL